MTATEWTNAGTFSVGVAITLRATVFLLGVTLVGAALRRAPGRVRHGLWSVAFLGLLAMPLLNVTLPPISVPLPVHAVRTASRVSRSTAEAPPSPGEAEAPPSSVRLTEPAEPVDMEGVGAPGGPISGLSMAGMLGLVWMAGTLLGLGALAAGLWRARSAVRVAESSTDPAWNASLADACRRVGVRRRVRLRFSNAVSSPMTGGLLHPVVLLPERARTWEADRRELVLLHELIHVVRADAARHLLGRLAAAIYWFHPMVWWAVRQAVLAREEACDETVLACGPRPSLYARHLLELAEPEWLPLPALARLERPHLEKRLMTILDPSAPRSRRGAAAWTMCCATLWTLSVAAAAPRGAAAPVVQTAEAPTAVAPPATAATATAATEAAPTEVAPVQEESCWMNDFDHFDGRFTQIVDEDGREIVERIGSSGDDRIVQTQVGDVRVCMRATGPVRFSEGMDRIESIGAGGRVVMATRSGGATQQLEMRGADGGVVSRWTVDGAERPTDSRVDEWRDATLGLVGLRWQVGQIRGQVSTLRGRISTIHGEVSTLQGEISTIHGHVSTLRGEISTIHGEESTLAGEISSMHGQTSVLRGEASSIRGRESTLRGALTTLQGRISTLEAARRATRDAQTRERLDVEIQGVQRQLHEARARLEEFDAQGRLAEVERRLEAYAPDEKIRAIEERRRDGDAEGRVRAIEEEMAKYDADTRVRAVEERIRAVNAEERIARIEREIEAVDAEHRVAELDRALPAARTRLERAVGAAR